MKTFFCRTFLVIFMIICFLGLSGLKPAGALELELTAGLNQKTFPNETSPVTEIEPFPFIIGNFSLKNEISSYLSWVFHIERDNIWQNSADFRLISRQVCDAMKALPERNRYVRGLVSWVGFRQTGVEFERDERYAGETKYPLRKMVGLAVSGMASFSKKPLRLASNLGIIASSAGFVWLTVLLVNLWTSRLFVCHAEARNITGVTVGPVS